MAHALLIVDVQNDFTEGGSMGVEGGGAVARNVSRLLAEHAGDYDVVIASGDWHDADNDNGGHFATDAAPDFVNTWPVHCVAGTQGAEYHPDLATDGIHEHVRKGQGIPAYSMFEGRTERGESMADLLTRCGITDVDVTGIATDYCVRASTLDALAHGVRARVFTDLIAGVAPESSRRALAEMQDAGAALATSPVAQGERTEAR